MGIGGDDDDDGGIWTVECLRGRLLAERVASKAAKAEADQMDKRVEVLERQVAEELRCRKRAERRMRRGLKKLESLKLSGGRLNLSESSSSSSACSSGNRRSDGLKPRMDSEQCGLEDGELREMVLVSEDFVGPNGSGDSAVGSGSTELSWTSVGTGHSCSEAASWVNEGDRDLHPYKVIDNVGRQSSVSSSKPSFTKHVAELRDSQQTSAAASLRSSSGSYRPNIRKVQDVLLSLRHLREQLQDSVGTRPVICSHKDLCGK